MTSSHIAELDITTLPPDARTVHIVPDLQNYSLVSIGQLCEAGCTAHFDKTSVTVWYKNQPVLVGTREGPNGLWIFKPSQSQEIPTDFTGAIDMPSTRVLVQFSHAAMFSPTNSTMEKAIQNNYLTGIPGLNLQSFRRFQPNSEATAMGHLDQVRQNKKSTKPKPSKESIELDQDHFPKSDDTNERTHHCFVAVQEITGQVHTDQTGRFRVPSCNGNNYVMVLYDYDSNAILVEPTKVRTKDVEIQSRSPVQSRMTDRPIPRIQVFRSPT